MNALPSDPGADLAAAEAARRGLTGALRLPSWFHTSIGVAVAVQIATAAYGLPEPTGRRLVALLAGAAVFLAVAAIQLARFRRLNRVRVAGLSSRAVMGTSTGSSLAYAVGLGGAVWAGLEDQWWAAALAAAAGGAAYGYVARRWWQAYRRDPAAHARAESRGTLLLVGGLVLAGLLVLVALR